jgi:hypothetical protein
MRRITKTDHSVTQTGLIILNVFFTKKYSLEIDKNRYYNQQLELKECKNS